MSIAINSAFSASRNSESTGPSDPSLQRGFSGPIRLFSEDECKEIIAHLRRRVYKPSPGWNKDQAVSDGFLFRLATRPLLVSHIIEYLGPDIILWGCSVVERKPRQVHPWHTDIESSDPSGGFASVWIGIENTSKDSGIHVIPASHLYGKTIQQVAHERGLERRDLSPEVALELAREIHPAAELREPSVSDGEAIFLDGRLWHGSHNRRDSGTRTALLFQYAKATAPVRIPDYRVLTWPFKFLEEPKPPAILVHGKAPTDSNHLVPPPRTNERIAPVVNELRSPIPEDPNRTRTHHHVFRGPTPVVEEMESHCSVLRGGSRPHPPHIHPEEEILISLHGEADIVLADDAEGSNSIKTRIAPGSVVYYPSGQYHTIENPNATSIAYLMFKWRAPPSQSLTPLGTSFFHFRDLLAEGGVSKRRHDLVFEAGTSQLAKLHCHFSRVPPGDGYASHIDAHDVAIVMLGGEVEVMNRTIKAHDVLFCPAGNEHGLRNASASQATYLVFEFHGHGSALSSHVAKKTGRPLISTRKLQRAFQRLKAAIFLKSR